MQTNTYHFKAVSLLITNYNRSKSLERLLNSFKQLNCSFGAIIVSDDGSKPEHLDYLKSIQTNYSFELITTPKNKGLANNINKGQDAVKTAYTLYVQEDFDPTPAFPVKLAQAVDILNEREEVDMMRFYAYFKYPHLTPFKNGFSEMRFNALVPGWKKFYQYSDHPHLRRSNFFEKFGRYEEGTGTEEGEYYMMMSFLKKKGKGLFYENKNELFEQKNTSSEPSTVNRKTLRRSNNFFISIVRVCYRLLKLHLNYFFGVRI
jgi:glycosyltransferase involved in cell wall biosynthesis